MVNENNYLTKMYVSGRILMTVYNNTLRRDLLEKHRLRHQSNLTT